MVCYLFFIYLSLWDNAPLQAPPLLCLLYSRSLSAATNFWLIVVLHPQTMAT